MLLWGLNMIKLQRLNVVRVVESEFEAEKWISKGFERVEESKPKKSKKSENEESTPKEGSTDDPA